MVTTTETMEIVTKPKLDEVVQPSFKRWLKHLLHMPASKRFFNQQDQYAIAQAVAAAEHGHIGEIQVVIEGHMPSREAYYLDTRGRAKQLFAELGVWDTELNSGILLYLNLCERKVEIVIDRGIQQATTQQVWDEVCQSIIAKMVHRNQWLRCAQNQKRARCGDRPTKRSTKCGYGSTFPRTRGKWR